jgi:exportin-7
MGDMEMLQSVESLAQQLYGSDTSNAARTEAERQLSVFGTNPETIDQSRFILERSQSPYAQHLAATSLIKIFTAHWGRFTNQQRLEIRNNVLSFLASHGPSLQSFVVVALVNLLCRITKLG